MHIHVSAPDGEAKIAFDPAPRVVHSRGLSPVTLYDIVRVASRNAEAIERAWNEHFG